MSADAISGGRSKSTPPSFSLTPEKAKEVWERFAEGLGMGRRRWLEVLRGEELGLAGLEGVLSGVKEEGRIGEVGIFERTGVET